MPSGIQKKLYFSFMEPMEVQLHGTAAGEHPVLDRGLPEIWFGTAASFSHDVNSAEDHQLRLTV